MPRPRAQRTSGEMVPGEAASPGSGVSYYYLLPHEPGRTRRPLFTADDSESEPALAANKIADERASLDGRFLSDLWLLLHLGIHQHPLAVLLSELGFVACATALLLWLLPVPASYTVAPRQESPLSIWMIALLMALTLVLPIGHAFTKGAAPAGAHTPVARLRCRSLQLLFACVQMYNVAGFFTAIVPSMIYQTLVARDYASLPSLLLLALCYISAATLAKALTSTAQASCALLWREALTTHVHTLYATRGAHYQLGLLLRPPLDNPDQRIAREVDLWSAALSELLVTAATSGFNVVWYTAQTWMITGWQGPAIIFAYFAASAALTRCVAAPVAALTARVQAAEGDFRAVHAALLHASETIALCSDGAVERASLGESFHALLAVRWQLIVRQGCLSLVTFFCENLGSIVNYAAVGIVLCSGVYDGRPADELSALISRGSTFAITMVYGLTQLIHGASNAAELSGHTRRVAALLRGLQHVQAVTGEWRRAEDAGGHAGGLRRRRQRGRDGPALTGTIKASPMAEMGTCLLASHQLCISVPPARHSVANSAAETVAGTRLLSGVQLAVRSGGNVLVRGPAGVGKTALLRTICGLWPLGEPVPGGISELACVSPLWDEHARLRNEPTFLVLPQAAPLRPGLQSSLIQQLAYPLLDVSAVAEHDALSALASAGLAELGTKLGLHTKHSAHEWRTELSPGQQQLLVCARAFVHKPALVLLDEATSSMPVDDEVRVYQRLQELKITYVSIGHRTSLERHHDVVLDLV